MNIAVAEFLNLTEYATGAEHQIKIILKKGKRHTESIFVKLKETRPGCLALQTSRVQAGFAGNKRKKGNLQI